jgi:hypothetical protein
VIAEHYHVVTLTAATQQGEATEKTDGGGLGHGHNGEAFHTILSYITSIPLSGAVGFQT